MLSAGPIQLRITMNTVAAPTITTPSRVRLGLSCADWCFIAGWAIIAAAAVGWILVMIPVWSSKDELNDRFLIPVASAVLVWLSWPQLRARALSPSSLGLLPLIIGAVTFALGWYVAV